MKEFTGDCLTVSGNRKLFCNACREEISLRKNITNHINCKKHKSSKDKLSCKEAREKDTATSLKVFDTEHHPVGETLPMEQRIYRLKVLRSFLRAAIPLSKLDAFRDLLEENALRLTDRHHMSDLIPVLYSQEQDDIKSEISNRSISIIFDGTTRLGEALAIVVRFVDDSFIIQQRLITQYGSTVYIGIAMVYPH